MTAPTSEEIQEIIHRHIQVKEYYHIIVCSDRITQKEFSTKEGLKQYLEDYWGYYEDNTMNILVNEIWEKINV